MTRVSLLFVFIALGVLSIAPARSQTPPTAAELPAYRGLHAAAARNDVAELRRLQQQGNDLDARDGNGRTPLHVAAFQGHPEAARILLSLGADSALLDNDRYDSVTVAAVANDVPTLQALLAGGASAKLTTSRYDGTALIAAAHLGHVGVVDALIRAGAPLDHVNNLGWTALLEAVILGDGGAGHTEVVRLLVTAGADRSIADRQGATPLQHAQRRGYAAIAQLIASAAAPAAR